MKKAICLCGGGSLGAYELGAWKYFREAGMDFDIFTGTSIGNINAVMMACDYYDELCNLYNTVNVNEIMKDGINLPTDPKRFKFSQVPKGCLKWLRHFGADISPLHEKLHTCIKTEDIKNCEKPIGIVTSTYPFCREVDIVLNEEEEKYMADWIMCSASCHPIFPIHRFDKGWFIDGAMRNALPLDLAFDLGADEAVAVILHCFPWNPQHKHLLNMPNVTTVWPSHFQGSPMDFDQVAIQQNIKLGYLDAAKTFGGLKGVGYGFKLDDRYDEWVKEYAGQFVNRHYEQYEKIIRPMRSFDWKITNNDRLFFRSLELMGKAFDMDWRDPYEFEEFVNELLTRVRSEENQKLVEKFDKKHNRPNSHVGKSKKKAFIAAMDKAYRETGDIVHYKDLANTSKHIIPLYEMYEFLASHDLIK